MSNIHNSNNPGTYKLGQVLRMAMARMSLNQKEFADKIGVSRVTLNYLINNKHGVSANVAQCLSAAFNRPVDFWMKNEFTDQDLDLSAAMVTDGRLSAEHGRLSNRGIKRAVDSKDLIIEPFSEEQIQPASINLRVGNVIENAEGNLINISDQSYWLMPEERILIKTLESLSLSSSIAGSIGGMSQLTEQLITYSAGHEVDPGYSGHFSFTIKNEGKMPFRVSAGMPIITMTLFQMMESSSIKRRKPENNQIADSRSCLVKSIEEAIEIRLQKTFLRTLTEYSIKGTNIKFSITPDRGNISASSLLLKEIVGIFRDITESGRDGGFAVLDNRRFRALNHDLLFLEDVVIPFEILRNEQPRLALGLNGVVSLKKYDQKMPIDRQRDGGSVALGDICKNCGVDIATVIVSIVEGNKDLLPLHAGNSAPITAISRSSPAKRNAAIA